MKIVALIIFSLNFVFLYSLGQQDYIPNKKIKKNYPDYIKSKFSRLNWPKFRGKNRDSKIAITKWNSKVLNQKLILESLAKIQILFIIFT